MTGADPSRGAIGVTKSRESRAGFYTQWKHRGSSPFARWNFPADLVPSTHELDPQAAVRIGATHLPSRDSHRELLQTGAARSSEI